jgi:tellurite methyltransferase
MPKATPLDSDIAKNVEFYRKDRGVTKSAMARHLGIAYQSYLLLERGQTSFTVERLLRIAEKLEVSFLKLADPKEHKKWPI